MWFIFVNITEFAPIGILTWWKYVNSLDTDWNITQYFLTSNTKRPKRNFIFNSLIRLRLLKDIGQFILKDRRFTNYKTFELQGFTTFTIDIKRVSNGHRKKTAEKTAKLFQRGNKIFNFVFTVHVTESTILMQQKIKIIKKEPLTGACNLKVRSEIMTNKKIAIQRRMATHLSREYSVCVCTNWMRGWIWQIVRLYLIRYFLTETRRINRHRNVLRSFSGRVVR